MLTSVDISASQIVDVIMGKLSFIDAAPLKSAQPDDHSSTRGTWIGARHLRLKLFIKFQFHGCAPHKIRVRTFFFSLFLNMLRKDFVQTARTSSWAINMPVNLKTLENDVYKLSRCDSGWDEAGVFLGDKRRTERYISSAHIFMFYRFMLRSGTRIRLLAW